MGSCSSSEQNTLARDLPQIKYTVVVTTGDKKFGGTDSSVGLVLRGKGVSTEKVWLDNIFKDDFQRGRTDEFKIEAAQLNDVESIELCRGPAISDEWFVDLVSVTNEETGQNFLFPIHRWLKPKSSIKISHLDACLPQFDKFSNQRKAELDAKRNLYQMEIKQDGNPPQSKEVPEDERFTFSYLFDLGKMALAVTIKAKIKDLLECGDDWNSIDHMLKVAYKSDTLPLPEGSKDWKDDKSFGMQRIASINSQVIRLCQEIPSKFPVTDEMVKPCLEGLTLQEAIDQNRLFIIDYEILTGIPVQPGHIVCDPFALFFVNGNNDLMPIAIQLKQEPSDDNPIFLPSDPEYTWLVAKMWFNNADAAYHQAITHLGYTHLLTESICIVTHRQLSMSHPLFKLLAPHFLYVMQINSLALNVLTDEGGWIDDTMNCGRLGVFELIKRRSKTWRLDVEGTLPEEMKSRGVLSSDILPKYYFRDDALKLYEAIRQYVSDYVELYYEKGRGISGDNELQEWVAELSKPAESGGAGIQGIPVSGKGCKVENKDQLVTIITSIIFISSVGHAAANFQQYDEYGFPPNYPVNLRGTPPTDKTALTEKDMLCYLPNQKTTFSIMQIVKILSEKGTNSLGNFEVMYIHDPKALAVLQKFQESLQEISDSVNSCTRDPPYTWLDPKIIPNSIGI